MSLARTCLFLTPLLVLGAAAFAQTDTSADLVMMQPLAAAAGGLDDTSARPSRLRLLSPADHDLFVRAFDAAGHGDWTGARLLADQGRDPVARGLLAWRYAMDKNSGAGFAQIDAVIKDTDSKTSAGTWPLRGTLQARAEAAMAPDMAPAAVIAWFGTKNPNSSIGKIRLGEALTATGQSARGARLIREGWAQGSFDAPTELAIVQKDAALLTPQSDRDRLDALLWRGETSAARRELSRVDDTAARIGEARIALGAGLPHAKAALDKVSGSDDGALLFDWAHALRLAHDDAGAHAMLLRVPAAAMTADHAARWWAELNLHARDALASGDTRGALALIQHAGFTAGDQFAEAQFLGGFITLRFAKDASAALPFFQRLEAGVTRPISKSRAQYWQGRCYEALGDTAAALSHYRLAASWPETFYGQVALAHIEAAPILHPTDTVVEAAAASELDGDALMPQIKVLAELGQEASLRAFIDRDVEVYASPRHLKRLMANLIAWGYPEIAVRLAKTASYAGATMPQFTHPLIALPAWPGTGPAPEPALVLGLIRQETEFDAYAVSAAGARGLMQMMPASAKLAAKQSGLTYRPNGLFDTSYNMQLGMTEFMGHMDRFGGSYVLAAASYNAGPTNARRWLTAYGDPRGAADPVDWIEQIPFSETRNYVQRVLENMEVYRGRLAGRDVPLKILADLYAPGAPSMPVLADSGRKAN